jgi:hypothetical protein
MWSPVFTTVYFGSIKFFRQRLLTSSPEEISKLIENMDKDCQNIRQEAVKISWFMRGGLTYDQAMALSMHERDIINNLIKDNFCFLT